MVVLRPSLRVSAASTWAPTLLSTPSTSWSGLGLWTGFPRELVESQMPRDLMQGEGGLGGEVGGVSRASASPSHSGLSLAGSLALVLLQWVE